MKAPTIKQAGLLRVLAGGAIAIAPGRREWNPLLRRGWVELVSEDDKDKRFLPPVRITVAGIRALADATERYPDELRPEIKQRRFEQLDEHPEITRLKERLAETVGERDQARRDLQYARVALSRCQQVIVPVIGSLR